MKINKSEIIREVVFTNKELKEKLGLEGDIEEIVLWKGDREKPEKTEWEFRTIEKFVNPKQNVGVKDD